MVMIVGWIEVVGCMWKHARKSIGKLEVGVRMKKAMKIEQMQFLVLMLA